MAHELNMNSVMSKKRLLTGNFPAKIFEPKFNTFMNITTTILEVRFVRSDMSTRKQLERQSLTQYTVVIKTLTVSWSGHVLVNLICARRP